MPAPTAPREAQLWAGGKCTSGLPVGTPGIRRARSRLGSSSYAGGEGRAKVPRKGIPASPEFQKAGTLSWGFGGRPGGPARTRGARGCGRGRPRTWPPQCLLVLSGPGGSGRREAAGRSLGRAGSLILCRARPSADPSLRPRAFQSPG